jgi:hypothetical protein
LDSYKKNSHDFSYFLNPMVNKSQEENMHLRREREENQMNG